VGEAGQRTCQADSERQPGPLLRAKRSMSSRLKEQGQYRLRQIPEISGAMVVMDRHTGRVSRWSADFSIRPEPVQPPRPRHCASPDRRSSRWFTPPLSTTATRLRASCLTPRSRSTPDRAARCLEAGKLWRQVLRSLDIALRPRTIAQRDDGAAGARHRHALIAEYAKRFGVYDNLPPYLSYALGAGETTVLRMVTAYSMLDNGGRRVKADADRSHPGPLWPYHLQARPARMRRLRRRFLA